MTAFIHSAFLQALGWAVVNSIWQMALLWIIYNAALSLPKSVRSTHKSNIAAAILFTGFAWFIFTFISLYISRDNNNALVSLNGFSATVNANLNTWLDSSLPYASILYIVLLIIPAFRFVRNYRYVQVLRKYKLGKIDVEWRMFIKKVSAQIGITKQVHIWVSDLITSPVTIGYLKPIILVPLAAINHLTPQQMEAVLLHELAHIRRYDYLINLLMNCIQTILYFNPFVKAFVKTIERERERSCDEIVIQFQYDPHNYASALLMLEKNNVAARDIAIAASGKNDLLSRVERILNIDTKPVFTFNKLVGLFAGLLCIIILNALIVRDKPVAGKESFAFQQMGSPFISLNNDEEKPTPGTTVPLNITDPNKEAKSEVIENHVAVTKDPVKNKSISEPVPADNDEADTDAGDATEPLVAHVNLSTTVKPELSKMEIKHVEATIEATRKVLENTQWKEVEKSIADAMTEGEKEVVKANYQKELEKVNWKKLGDKLKASYDQLNWDKINDQIGSEMTKIKLDSLVEVYNVVKETLDEAEKSAVDNDTINKQVPIPDVSIENIRLNKQKVQTTLTRLKAIRSKKIVHL